MKATYKKEVLLLFRSMMGYLYTAFLLLITGVFFIAFNLQGGAAELGYVLGNTTVVLLIVIPVTTMRVLGEEQQQKTDQLLLTAPVRVSRIVLDKFFAIPTVSAVLLTVLTAYPLMLSLYGAIPLKKSYSCFLAFLFMGAVCIAIDILISSITESQVIAAAGTFATMLCSYLINGMSSLMGIPAVDSVAGLAVVVLLGEILLAVVARSLPLGAAATDICRVGLGAVYLVDNIVFEDAFPRFLGFSSLFQRYYDFVGGIFDITYLMYYLGIVVLLLLFAMQSVEKRRQDSFKGKYFKIGLCAVIMRVLAVVIMVLPNLVAYELPSRYTKYGTSASGLYSISPQTREAVSANKAPISLYLIISKGKEDRKLMQFSEKYRDLSGRITVEYAGPILSPGFVPEHTSDKVSDNSITMVGKKRFRILCNTDLYSVNYDYDAGRTTMDFDGGGQIANAVHCAASDTPSEVCLINGHRESELTEPSISTTGKKGVEAKLLNLTSANRVPEDGGCLFLNVSVSDLTDRERDVLVSYLEQEGRMLLIIGVTATRTPSPDQVLANCGISAVQGMIAEGDSDCSIPSYPNFLFPEIRSSQTTEPFISEDSLLLIPNAHGIVKMGDVCNTAEADGTLTTSSNFYIKTDSSSLGYMRDNPIGPFAVGITVAEWTDGGEARIVWFSNSGMLTEGVGEMVGGSSTDPILNSIEWTTEQENSITIHPKPASSAPPKLISAQAIRWSVLFVLTVPATVMTGGSTLYIRRRRRQRDENRDEIYCWRQ